MKNLLYFTLILIQINTQYTICYTLTKCSTTGLSLFTKSNPSMYETWFFSQIIKFYLANEFKLKCQFSYFYTGTFIYKWVTCTCKGYVYKIVFYYALLSAKLKEIFWICQLLRKQIFRDNNCIDLITNSHKSKSRHPLQPHVCQRSIFLCATSYILQLLLS